MVLIELSGFDTFCRMKEVSSTIIDHENILPKRKSEIEIENYNLDEVVKVWSDFNKVHHHHRSLVRNIYSDYNTKVTFFYVYIIKNNKLVRFYYL